MDATEAPPPAPGCGVSRLREIVARLRGPDGCPWDIEQTHASLRAALVEECYEAIEAIDLGDDENLREELGDLLLHVVMHAQMADERGAFTFDRVAHGICDKLVRRHPHVFGDAVVRDTSDVLARWEQIKASEKPGRSSALDGVPPGLPALMRAQKTQKKAARCGFDWGEAGAVLPKIDEEVAEVRHAMAVGGPAVAEEIGDLLFSVVNLARKLDIDAEETLRAATRKFSERFRAMEREVAASGRTMESLDLAELDAVWDAVKAREAC